jgi:ubiquinone/menaquinone biosynthesis C-methylase UbiE
VNRSLTENDVQALLGADKDSFERIAPGFVDPALEAQHRARYVWAARHVRGSSVVDVATGTGYGAAALRAAGAYSVCALDSSLAALEFGRNRYGTSASRADAHELPLTTGSVDVVVSLETIEHLSRPRTFLREVHRVLRREGRLLVSTPNATLSDGGNHHHVKEFSRMELEDALQATGFALTKRAGQHWHLGPHLLHRVPGVRRLAFEIERRTNVHPVPLSCGAPRFWCLVAEKASR